jgi:GAF domain-containing protein
VSPHTDESFVIFLLALEDALNEAADNTARMRTTLDFAQRAAGADRGFVLTHGKVVGDLQVVAAHNIDPEALWTTAEVSTSIIRDVMKSGEPVLSDNASQDPRFSDTTSVVLSGLRSVLCMPIKSGNKTVGLVYLDNRFADGIFSARHVGLLEQITQRLSSRLIMPRQVRRTYRGPRSAQNAKRQRLSR